MLTYEFEIEMYSVLKGDTMILYGMSNIVSTVSSHSIVCFVIIVYVIL